MPVDLRQISFYPQQRQYIFSDSEPGIEVVQSGSGDYIKCTDENNAVVFRIANDGLISSAAGQAEYSTLSSSTGNPITLVAQGANQDVRFMHTSNSTANVMMFLDGATKHMSIGGAHDSTPDSRLHVFGATAGSVTAVTDTIITAENDDNAFISLLAPTSSGILFGDVADADIGRITYTHSDNALNLYVSASQQFAYTDATLQFKKATSLTTSAGALTIAPVSGAHLDLTLGGAGDLRVNTSQLYVDTSAARVGVNTATPSAGLEVVVSESATVPALMVQNSFNAASNQVAVFRGSNRGTAADNDSSYITYEMEDSAGNMVEVGRQIWQINDVTSNTKDSKFTWQVMVNNTLTDMLEISSSAAAVPTATFASGDAIFNDNVSIRLGTAGVEADLSSNGTDVKWEFAATADLLIGRASSPAPDGLVHIWAATAGSVQAPTDSLLTLEKDDNAYITFLAPTVSGINFGDAADNNVGSITYTHSSNTLNTTINAASQLNHTDGAFAFAKATTVSTSSGTLTINAFTAGGAINFASQAMTSVDINSGTIGGVTIDGTSTATADVTFNDNVKVTLGTGGDVDVYYDATDMVINTRVAGTGDLVTHSQIVWGTGVAVTAADYSIGRDADGTNQMHLNVPSSSGWEFSINDTAKLTYATGAFNFTEATSITTSAGQLTIDGAGGVVINEDGDDEDFRIETNSNANTLVIDANTFGGTGSIGLGNAVVNTAYLRIAPIAITSTADQPYAAVRIAPVGVTVPSGTSSVVSSLTVVEPVISATGTVTVAATVYIQNAPTEGTNDYALFVDAGATRLDGTLTASGGGALTGTWSDLGTVSTIDINGGSIDGITLGTNAAVTQAVIDDIDLNGKVITMTGSSSDTAVFTAGTNGTLSIVTTDAAAAAANIQITADGTVDIDSAGVLTLDSGAAINLEPAAGSAILLDGTISIDGGAVTGVVSIFQTDVKIGEDDETKIDFETVNTINFYVNNAKDLVLSENALTPGTSDGTALGTTSLMWSDLFLASGSVVNFNNGDVTLTHSANTLTLAGGTLAAAAITGTTIDASTDFTIGSTVITDDVITFTPSSSDTVTLTSSTNGAFSLVTVDDAAAAANIQITADGTVDIDSAGVLTLDSGAAINLEPAGGSAILLDGTISVDAGVVTGATSITSTAFLGTLDGVVGGNTPAAITGTAIIGTTIDATTDFTIGSLVITDDSIVMTPTASDTVTIAGAANGAFSIVTVDAGAAAANIQITADGTVDIDSAGVLTLDSGAAINLEPAAGSAILLDGTISVDAGVVTNATSITSTDFVGNITGTVLTATQNSITTMTGLVTTGALNAGSITSGFTSIDVGSGAITTTGTVTTGALAINGNITTAAARTWTLLDNDATALSFDASGKTGMLVFDTRNGSERVTLSGNVLVSGDFEVAGSSTTVSTTVIVADPLVALATTNTGNAVDIGFFGRYRTNGTNLYTGFVWDANVSKYILFHGNQAAPDTTVNTGGTGYTASTLVLGTLESSNIAAHTLTGKLTAGSVEIEGSGFDINGGDMTGVTISGALTWSAAQDLNNQALTNINVDSGAIDGVTLGTNSAITNAVIDDVAINGKVITMTGSASDTATMTAATNGAFSLVTVDAAAAAANIQITADGTVDIDSAGALTLDSGAAINLEPASGSVILLDGTISVDAGVVTGVTAFTSATIDATTDFTIGSLIITDDQIQMTPTASDTITIAGAANGAFSIVTVDDAAAAANIQITADGTVDIDSAGVLTLDSGAAINIEPAGGSAILLDGTISIDAGVVTGATSITSTAFLGTLDGVIGGNTPAAITGTTIDATTDFTIGSTVITDDVITFTPSSSDTVTMTSSTNGAFSLVTVDNAAAAANIQITADGTVDIDSAGVLTLDSGAAINIEPAGGSAILLDGTISIDAGVVIGATSITSTNFVGTVTTATQNSITTMTGLVTTGALNSGSIASGFGAIDIGSDNLTATGTISLGATSFNDQNLTNVGGIALDTITSDAGAGITITPTTDTFFSNGTGVVIGHTAQLTVSAADGATPRQPEFQIAGTVGTIDGAALITTFNTNGAGIGNASTLNFAKSRGRFGTVGTAVGVTDSLGTIVAYGDDGTDMYSPAAAIHFEVDGTVGTGVMPGKIAFYTTPASSEALAERVRIDALGRVFIGDTTIGTSVDMDTAGLVINQAGGDKHILALKSSDVGHGMTTVAETDTYGFIEKSDTMGGLRIEGLKASGGTHSGLSMRGVIDGTQNSTKGTAGTGTITLDTAIRNGTGVTAVGANGNIFSIRNNGATRFIFDAEGDFYSDASINADFYDDYNDPVLVRDLDLAITQRFDQWTQYNRADVERAKLVHFDEKDQPFVNWTRVWKLHNGAIWQLYEKMERLEEENKSLKENLSKMLTEG